MARKRLVTIYLSRHAIRRWRERVGDDSLARIQTKIRKGIRSALKKGLSVNEKGTLLVNIILGVRAVIVPDARGGWRVITIICYETKGWWRDAAM